MRSFSCRLRLRPGSKVRILKVSDHKPESLALPPLLLFVGLAALPLHRSLQLAVLPVHRLCQGHCQLPGGMPTASKRNY